MHGILLGLFLLMLVAARIMMIVRGFQTSVGWGLVTLLVPLGWIVFVCVQWERGRRPLAYLLCALVGTVATLVTEPHFVEGFERGFAAGQQRAAARHNAGSVAASKPHEVRDLAENEAAVPAATPTPFDPRAVQRAALAKHGADLMAEYQQLSAQRAALKPGGGPAVKAFNAKAAHYQSGLLALQAEQRQLDALDHPGIVPANVPTPGPSVDGSKAAAVATVAVGGIEGEANAALGRLRASIGEGNYAGFAATLRKCLADYRQTKVFPQITAYARQVMRDAPPAKLSAALQQQAKTAQQEYDATTRQVQAIVNQTPPTVVPPQGSTEVYWRQYDPGASKPDFNVADVVTGREDWSGDYTYMKTRPGVFYRSADCEFNPQTKFFITDRNVPKKKLTDAENAEVVRLYRTLGKDETILDTLPRRLAQADQTSAELLVLNTQISRAK